MDDEVVNAANVYEAILSNRFQCFSRFLEYIC